MKTIAQHLGIVVVFLTTFSNTFGATLTWDGGGGNNSWHSPLNWSGDKLPGPSDDVVIPAANTSVLVTNSVTINGLTLGSGTTLTAQGSAAIFTAKGNTGMNGADLYVKNGGVLSLPGLTKYQAFWEKTWKVEGKGSVLSMPGLTNVVGSPDSWYPLNIEAWSGGRLELGNVQSITNWVIITADGTNSAVVGNTNVSLGPIAAANISGTSFYARNGGSIILPNSIATLTGYNNSWYPLILQAVSGGRLELGTV